MAAGIHGAFALHNQQGDTQMTMGQHNRAAQASDRLASLHKSRPRQRQLLAAHRVFAPALGIWGAALAGLPIMVLPSRLVADSSRGTGLGLLGNLGQPVMAMLCAVVLGGTVFMIANLMNHQARRHAGAPSIASLAARRVHTINPQRDLGSDSLDEPVKAVPIVAAALRHQAAATRAAVAPVADMPPPRALDLAEFAQLPGRNGVWVEDLPAQAEAATPPPAPTATSTPAPAPVIASQPLRLAPEPARRAAAPVHPSAAALERLRAVPTQELSIVQMVERFAAALHDHREAAPGTVAAARDIAGREAALAQALRALAALSGEPASGPVSAPVSALQGRRGAA